MTTLPGFAWLACDTSRCGTCHQGAYNDGKLTRQVARIPPDQATDALSGSPLEGECRLLYADDLKPGPSGPGFLLRADSGVAHSRPGRGMTALR
jgi:hypothetical protein